MYSNLVQQSHSLTQTVNRTELVPKGESVWPFVGADMADMQGTLEKETGFLLLWLPVRCNKQSGSA